MRLRPNVCDATLAAWIPTVVCGVNGTTLKCSPKNKVAKLSDVLVIGAQTIRIKPIYEWLMPNEKSIHSL